jgi:hypothetical protein
MANPYTRSTTAHPSKNSGFILQKDACILQKAGSRLFSSVMYGYRKVAGRFHLGV